MAVRAGKISYVRECPEHFAKVASASPLLLRLSAPFIRDMSALPGGITDAIGEELQRYEQEHLIHSRIPISLPPPLPLRLEDGIHKNEALRGVLL